MLIPGTVWRLERSIDGHARCSGSALATQIAAGRTLRLLQDAEGSRWRVRLLEDGYPCWIEAGELQDHGRPARAPAPAGHNRAAVVTRLEEVVAFALAAMDRPNTYLWGGTLGPDYDCSGLVQSAFAATGIWLPRDAYLQERFCQAVAVRPGQYDLLLPGDLVFFGSPQRCTHVGLHLGGGRYLHSSGRQHGRDGIGIDDLHPHNQDPVACHYRAELRGAGRVMHSHDGSPWPT
ncbi:MAG: NlpC/P60 family protein [Prochlorococcaceae cyanobacterium]|jgi:cell wall-associated NlpC family hydrolase